MSVFLCFISEYSAEMEGNTEQSRLCPLCEDSLIEGETVCVRKGISTLVEASKKRGDNKWQKWTSLSVVEVHLKCRKDYTREKCITAATRLDTNNPLKKRVAYWAETKVKAK